MANTLLNSQIITRTFLDVLHQKVKFIGSINRDYDGRFGQDNKIGASVDVRLPSELAVTKATGNVPTYSAQNVIDRSVRVSVDRYAMVPFEFTDRELSLNVEDFKTRYVVPAATRLASVLEADALTMVNDIPSASGTFGTTPTGAGTGAGTAFFTYMQGKAKLDNQLAPDEGRKALLNVDSMINVVDSLKGLFNDDGEISAQYKDAVMGHAAGFDWMQTTLMPSLTNGNKVSTTVSATTTDGATSITLVCAVSDTFKVGQVFTVANVNAVHPETKTNIGPKQFVVAPGTDTVNGYSAATQTYTATGTTIIINIVPASQVAVTGANSPGSLWATGAYQNISAHPQAAAAVTFQGTTGATTGTNILYHRNAFSFVTVPLTMPGGMDMAYVATADGLSVRFVRGFDIINAKFVSRMDIQYGFRTIRPEYATRVWSA